MTPLAKWSSVTWQHPKKAWWHISQEQQLYIIFIPNFKATTIFRQLWFSQYSTTDCCHSSTAADLLYISNQQQQGWWLAPNHFPWVLLPPPLAPSPSHYYIQNEQAFYYFLSNNQGNCLASQKYRSPPLRGFYNGGIGKALLLYLLSRRSEGLTLAFDAKLI